MTDSDLKRLYPISATINSKNHFTIAGSDLSDLAETYRTPFYVYDRDTIHENINQIRSAMADFYSGPGTIAYASKAYLSRKFASKIATEEVDLDVVSLTELRFALAAGFSPDRIHFHGNNKSIEEIEIAVDQDIHAIVVDNMDELLLTERIANSKKKVAQIWLRITPDIRVATHPHIETSAATSKFGFHIINGDAANAIEYAVNSSALCLTGLHCHLGSQLFDPLPYQIAIEKMFDLAINCHYTPLELSPGGGWGVPYVEDDPDNNPEKWVKAISETITEKCNRYQIRLPKLILESGRFIVARSGVAIYQIGTQKKSINGERIIAVDGGLSDNPRNALYQAKYTANPVDQSVNSRKNPCKVVGKYCESGDVLIDNVMLPDLNYGDLLMIPVAGAYQLSMASNYNLAPRPIVLWLEPKGKVEVLQERENLEQNSWWD